jgi:hypothetical protein
MPNYYVNRRAQSNGDHEVHTEKCEYLSPDRVYLGHFASCEDATLRAREQFRQVNGCYWCSRGCHAS